MPRNLVPWSIALVAALHAASFAGYGPCDDDFITYRYARNLIEGHGLVFNPGERVEGFSAPGWLLLVALAMKNGIDPASFSVALSIVAGGVAAFCIAKTWFRAHPGAAFGGPAWLVAASPAIAWHAIVGLGTVLLAALLAWWFERWDRAVRDGRSALAAAALLGCACLVRNESALFVVPFVFAEARRKRLAPALVCLLPLAAWQAFRVAYFGRWLPITWTVKKLGLAADLELGARYLAEANAATGIGLAVILGAFALARTQGELSRPLRAVTAGLVAHVLYVAYVGGDFFPLARFFVPVLPLAGYVACAGFASLWPQRRVLATVALAAAVVWLQVPQARRAELRGVHANAEPRWTLMGRAVKRRVPPQTRVALAPIGAFGYESGLYVVDMLGLTNTAIARAEPDPGITIKGHQRYDAEWVLAQRPEMIIIGNGWLQPGPDGEPTLIASHWEGTLVAHPRLQSDYERLRVPIEGSYDLVFYWRRDAPRPLDAQPI